MMKTTSREKKNPREFPGNCGGSTHADRQPKSSAHTPPQKGSLEFDSLFPFRVLHFLEGKTILLCLNPYTCPNLIGTLRRWGKRSK